MKQILTLLLLMSSLSLVGQARKRLPEPINLSDETEYAPSISADGRTLIFQSSRYGIFVSGTRKVPKISDEGNQQAIENKLSTEFFGLFEVRRHPGGEWLPPKNIEAINRFDTGITPVMGGPSISYDGNTLFFFANYSIKGVGFGREDIYYSIRERYGWSQPTNIGPAINTPGYEGFPSISPDGRQLYFVRENLTTKGETQQVCYSLMMAEKNRDGQWKRPIELPAPVNMACEKAPRIMADGKTLVFSSIKADGKGDFDLYMARFQDDGTWSDPVPLAFINTKRSDQSVAISACGDLMYYVSDGDIYTTAVPETLRPFKMGTVQGFVTDSLTGAPIATRLNITETGTGKLYATLENSPTDGRYTALIPTNADYTLTVNVPDYRTRTVAISRDLFATCEVVARDLKLFSVKTLAASQTGDIIILKDEPLAAAEPPPVTPTPAAATTPPRPLPTARPAPAADEEVIVTAQVAGPTVEKLSAEQVAEKRLTQFTVEDSLRRQQDAARLLAAHADSAGTSATIPRPTALNVTAPPVSASATPPAATAEPLNVIVLVRDVETDSTLRQATVLLTDVTGKTPYETTFSAGARGYAAQLPPHTSVTIRASAPGYTTAQATVNDIVANKRLVLKIMKTRPSVLKVRVLNLATGTLLPTATLTIRSKTTDGRNTQALPTGQTELTYTATDAVELQATAPGYTSVSRSLVIELADGGKIYEFEAKLDRITFALKASAVDIQTGKPLGKAVFQLVARATNSTQTLTTDPETGMATTPLPGIGSYDLTCEVPGYTPKTQPLLVDKEQTDVVFRLGTLPRKTQTIILSITDQFTGEAIGAQLNVTGATVGSISPPLLTAPDGVRIDLTATAVGYGPATRSFMATDTLARPVVIRLARTAYEFTFRTLSVTTRKPVLDATVMLLAADSKQRQITETTYDKTTVLLAPGRDYIIGVKAAGFENYQSLFKPQEALKNNTLKRDLLLTPVAAATPAAPTAQVIETRTSFGTIEKGKAIVLTNLYFDQSSPVLRPESGVQLDELVKLMTQNPTLRIEIRGHTDNAGDFDLNLKLSRDRCGSVIGYLAKQGIAPARMQPVGRGPLDPIAPNTTEDNRKKNRRVEFVVL